MFGSRGLSGMTIDSIHGLCIVAVSLLKPMKLDRRLSEF